MSRPTFALAVIGAAFMASLIARAAHAQSRAVPQAPPPIGPVNEEVIVTASRLEERLRDVPAAVEVITRDEIRRSPAKTVDELLREIAGFSILRQGNSRAGHPTVRSPSMRGLGGSSSRTLVLLDGVPMNDSATGSVYWARIPLDQIERIEVVKSGGSGIWGNLAMGGVINIITRVASRDSPTANAHAEVGSQSTTNVHASVRQFKGPVGLALDGDYFKTGGYSIVRSDQIGGVDRPVTDTTGNLDLRLDGRSSPRAKWTLAASIFDEKQGSGTILTNAGMRGKYLRGNVETTTSGGSHWQFAGFLTHQNAHTFLSSVGTDRQSETPASSLTSQPATTLGANVHWSKPLGHHHLLSVGGDGQWLDVTSFEDFNFVAASGQFSRKRRTTGEQFLAGLFLEDFYQLTPAWRITAAIRVDGIETRNGSRQETDVQTGNFLRDETYSNHRTIAIDPNLGTVIHAGQWLTLRGSVYRSFRSPTPIELYRPIRSRGNVITEPNPQLNAERLLGGESGVEAALGRRIRARVTGFWDRLDDPISFVTIQTTGATGKTVAPCGFVPALGTCRQRMNLGRLRSVGVEPEFEFRPRPSISVAASYVWNRSTVLAAPGQPQVEGKFSRQSPEHQAVLQAGYDNARGMLTLFVQVRLVGRRFEDDLNSLPIGRFVSIDVNASHVFSPRASAFVTVQNLLNRINELTRSEDGTVLVTGPRQINAGLRVQF